MQFVKSIWAGVAISIGAMIYINVGGPIGAVLFSIGLLMVLSLKLNLYTGFVGYFEKTKDILDNLYILVGNFIGCWFSLLMKPESVINLIDAKLAMPWYEVFIKAFLCGVLIYTAVHTYKLGHWYITPFAVPAFILIGAEHSIADMCYFIGARVFTWEALAFISIVVLGNAIGAIALHQTLTHKKKSDIINI